MLVWRNEVWKAWTSGDDGEKQRLFRGEEENAEKKTASIWGMSSGVAGRIVMGDMIAVGDRNQGW